MDNLTPKAVMILVASTVLGIVITGITTWLIATSGAGMDSAEKARIIAIYEQQQELDDGRTVKQVLTALDKSYGILANDVENIDENIVLMRKAMEAIASDG